MGRNLTIHLDDQTVTRAKVLAARRATSVSRLVAEEIERLVNEDDAYRLAESSAVARLEGGYRLGGGPLPERDALHER